MQYSETTNFLLVFLQKNLQNAQITYISLHISPLSPLHESPVQHLLLFPALLPDIVSERERLVVAFVGLMLLTEGAGPGFAVKLGEEDVSFLRGGVNVSEAETISDREGCLVDACAANDEDFFVIIAGSESSVKGREHLNVLPRSINIRGENYVAAIGQCTLGQRFKSAASHDDGVARGQRLEATEISAEVIEKIVVVADCIVVGERTNY